MYPSQRHHLNSKILVTGGAGYIGSIVTAELIAAGASVTVLDNLSTGHREAVHREALFIQGDLKETALVDEVLARGHFDAVMHFASHTLVGESMEKPFLYLGDNVTNALNLLRSVVAHKVPGFVFSSTANMFSDPVRLPIEEEERIVPSSPYGESKFLIERMLQWFDKLHGLRSICLRYFNAAGASPDGERGEDHKPEHHLIPSILQVALGQREKIVIFGDDYPTPDGTCVRDYVHVTDLVQAHLMALKTLERGSRTYNLGNSHGFSVKEVVEMAREVTSKPIPVEIGPRRPGDPAILVAGSECIKRELGWQPHFAELRTIMETAWNWHRRHPEGYTTQWDHFDAGSLCAVAEPA